MENDEVINTGFVLFIMYRFRQNSVVERKESFKFKSKGKGNGKRRRKRDALRQCTIL